MLSIDAPTLVRLMECPSITIAAPYVEPIRESLLRAVISTPVAAAHYFAQTGHECGGLKWMEELATGDDYDIRINPQKARGLGNTEPGDGRKYKAHGIIGCTGKNNHLAFGIWMGVGDLFVREPKLIATNPRYAVMTAPWFFTTHNLVAIANADDGKTATVQTIDPKTKQRKMVTVNAALNQITRSINGWTMGIEDRQRRFVNAKAILTEAPARL